MNDLKRCCGYKGEWACADEYPDHVVPTKKFGVKTASHDGFQERCWQCKKLSNKYSNDIKNPRNNAISAIAYKMAGGYKVFYGLPKIERIAIRGKVRQEIEAEAWLGTIFPRPHKDNLPRSKPARKRVSTTYDRLLPKEGWVYIMDTYRYNKIGKTWEDGLRARRAEARRWGPADLVYWAWFDDAMAAEKEIHRRLKRYKVEKENVVDIKIATLLFKPDAYTKDIHIDFIGKLIPNDFVVGYGLDYDEFGRNLPHIYKLKN